MNWKESSMMRVFGCPPEDKMSKGDIKMKAQYISVFEIKLPTPEDYLEDGITFKDPSRWYDLVEYPKQKDVNIFKNFVRRYYLISDAFGGPKEIFESWKENVSEKDERCEDRNTINKSLV